MPLCDFIGHSWPARAQRCYIGVCTADATVRFVLRLPSRVSVITLLAMLLVVDVVLIVGYIFCCIWVMHTTRLQFRSTSNLLGLSLGFIRA